MPRRHPQYLPQRINMRVPRMAYTAGVEGDDIIVAEFGAPAALNNTALLAAQSINVAGTVTPAATYTGSETQMSRWGRGVRIVASAAATSQVTITGRDYLGQVMVETLTLNGTTPVNGVKAFRYIDRISFGATSGVTIDVGLTNVLGLPYKFRAVVNEIKNGAASANPGTFVVGLDNGTPATATNADVRGTYTPATVVPNGTNTFEVRYVTDTSNLHGNAQFGG